MVSEGLYKVNFLHMIDTEESNWSDQAQNYKFVSLLNRVVRTTRLPLMKKAKKCSSAKTANFLTQAHLVKFQDLFDLLEGKIFAG